MVFCVLKPGRFCSQAYHNKLPILFTGPFSEVSTGQLHSMMLRYVQCEAPCLIGHQLTLTTLMFRVIRFLFLAAIIPLVLGYELRRPDDEAVMMANAIDEYTANADVSAWDGRMSKCKGEDEHKAQNCTGNPGLPTPSLNSAMANVHGTSPLPHRVWHYAR
ncbi:unnamed protein product [Rhizoctonia solani]|uniref:Uncharacterized protein n=1 Tax=Rhizoctonia solani TaxID=456999 RepID=A0A8H3BBP2_9AGAM|nr:unnamed protein product [Rhizoctonia solani]